MSECETVKIQADGIAVSGSGDRMVGGQPPIQTVSFPWCRTHDQPHQLCKEDEPDA